MHKALIIETSDIKSADLHEIIQEHFDWELPNGSMIDITPGSNVFEKISEEAQKEIQSLNEFDPMIRTYVHIDW